MESISRATSPSEYPSYECFYFLEPSRVIICTSCQIALIQSRLKNHLSLNNHDYSNKKRKEVINWAYELEGLISSESDISNVVFPPKESSPIEGLLLETNGFACTVNNCNYITGSKETIRKHLRDSHQITGKKGRPLGGPKISLYRRKVKYQRFFSSGPSSYYFEVGYSSNNPTISEGLSEGSATINNSSIINSSVFNSSILYSRRGDIEGDFDLQSVDLEGFNAKAARIKQKNNEEIRANTAKNSPNP
jgi:Orsellinic acid/F9775 biosynthesis cluster protein D